MVEKPKVGVGRQNNALRQTLGNAYYAHFQDQSPVQDWQETPSEGSFIDSCNGYNDIQDLQSSYSPNKTLQNVKKSKKMQAKSTRSS